MSRPRAPTPRGPISTLGVLNCDQFYRLSIHVSHILIKLPPPKVISGLLSNIQKVGLFCVILGLFPFELSGTLCSPRALLGDFRWYSKKNIPRTVLENETFSRNTSSSPRTVLEHGKKFGCTRKFRILGSPPTPPSNDWQALGLCLPKQI